MSWTLYWVLLAIGIVMPGIFLFLRVKKGGISAVCQGGGASLFYFNRFCRKTQTVPCAAPILSRPLSVYMMN